MKYILLIFLTLLINFFSFAQLQNANWCFGNNAKLSFNSLPPTASASSINLNVDDCSVYSGSVDVASVSDNNGQLLFYTNGHKIWGKNNLVMSNGNHLYSTSSQTTAHQYICIVQKPNHPNLYYIFNTSSGFFNGHCLGHEGIYYSVVDMSLNSGNGDVVSGLKNIPLRTPSGQLIDYDNNTNIGLRPLHSKITSTLHFDADKIWISFLLRFDNAGIPQRFLYSYLVGENGINNSVDGVSPICNSSSIIDNVNYPSSNVDVDFIGYIKTSPNGAYLCDAAPDAVNLYNFNNQTGTVIFNSQVYSDITWLSNSGYGVEFSPNSQLLYFSTYDNNITQQGKLLLPSSRRYAKIYQKNISKNQIEVIKKVELIDNSIDTLWFTVRY
jgi:large repetitive protein